MQAEWVPPWTLRAPPKKVSAVGGFVAFTPDSFLFKFQQKSFNLIFIILSQFGALHVTWGSSTRPCPAWGFHGGLLQALCFSIMWPTNLMVGKGKKYLLKETQQLLCWKIFSQIPSMSCLLVPAIPLASELHFWEQAPLWKVRDFSITKLSLCFLHCNSFVCLLYTV